MLILEIRMLLTENHSKSRNSHFKRVHMSLLRSETWRGKLARINMSLLRSEDKE